MIEGKRGEAREGNISLRAFNTPVRSLKSNLTPPSHPHPEVINYGPAPKCRAKKVFPFFKWSVGREEEATETICDPHKA